MPASIDGAIGSPAAATLMSTEIEPSSAVAIAWGGCCIGAGAGFLPPEGRLRFSLLAGAFPGDVSERNEGGGAAVKIDNKKISALNAAEFVCM